MNAAILSKIIVVWNICSELVAVNVLQYRDGISGQITSPGYPGNYPNNVNYTWIIRTGSHSAKVTFRIVEMNINEIKGYSCDDYLEIEEIEPRYFRHMKRCGHSKNFTILGRGEKIKISFISDRRKTDRGFYLTWRVYLPSTIAMPKTKVTTKKMLTTTTKNNIKTTSKKKDKETTTLQQKTTTLTSSHANSIKQVSGTNESTTEDTSTYNYISPTTSKTLITKLPSTVKNSGRTTNPDIRSELSSSQLQKKPTTLQKHSRPLTLAATTRSFSVEVTISNINATFQTEDQDTFNIHTVYLIIGSVVVEFFLLLVACVCIYRCRNKGRSLQKNQCQQKRDEGARNFVNGAYWKSVHVYETIPVDALCGLETCPEETNEDIDEQSTFYDKCWRNEYDRAQSAMEEENRDNAYTYKTCERFYFTLQATHPTTPPATSTSPQRDSTNFYHTVDNSSLPK